MTIYGVNTFKKVLFANILFINGPVFAGTPLWTFQPLTDTTIVLPSNGTATVKYQVTNQSRKPHKLAMRPTAGITQLTTLGNCPSIFTLNYQQSCTLTLEISGSELNDNIIGGPEVCEQGSSLQCYQPSRSNSLNITLKPEPGTTTLSASISNLILRVSGSTRIITIENTGAFPAANVNYSISPALPGGTSISPAGCGTIIPGGNCVLSISPGATPSTVPASGTGSEPIPNVVTVSGSNTNSTSINVTVLTFGNILQNGLVYFINDSTPQDESVTGSVVTGPLDGINELTSQWNSNLDSIVTGLNGVVNTNNITANNGCTDENNCAAYRCRNLNGSPTPDWYLPALNELIDIANIFCPNNTLPCSFGEFSNLSYFSSSQLFPEVAWHVNFPLGDFNGTSKVLPLSIRCARAFS